MRTVRKIIDILRNPTTKDDVAKLLDDEIGPLVERVVTAGRNIPLLRSQLFDYVYGTYVYVAREMNRANEAESKAKLAAAHDRAEATELYAALRVAYGELDKMRFGQPVDSNKITSIGEELFKYDRPIRYGKGGEHDQ